MSTQARNGFLVASALTLFTAALGAQGPGSCGFHLDVLAPRGTSTHAAIADVPGAPGQVAGIAPGAPGNPYCAWTPGPSPIRIRVTVAPGTLGPAPIGAGSVLAIYYGVATPNIPVTPPGVAAASCSGGPWIISVLPLGGALVDGLGLTGTPPLILPSDPGHPGKFELSMTWPLVAAPPVMFQAAFVTPGGVLAVSNGVSVMTGTNPNETDLIPSLAPSTVCGFGATDEGWVAAPAPAGFQFYGMPATTAVARPNGYVEFGPAAGIDCDFNPAPSGLGCPPTFSSTSPRVSVNHFDTDLLVQADANHPPGLTAESVPAAGTTPSRTILRWKNVCPWYEPSFSVTTSYASFVCELWSGNVPSGSSAVPSSIVVVRQEHRTVNDDYVHGFFGIGPGDTGQGFGGPASACSSHAFHASYGGFYYTGALQEAMYLLAYGSGNSADSVMLSNLATVFRPAPAGAYAFESF